MGANCFLVRYAAGWAERKSASSISTYGRQEALLGLGAISSLAEVNRVADGQLTDFAAPREQTDILIDPRHNGEAPYLGGPQVGDTVTVQGEEHRVLALSVTEDVATDRVIFVPSLNENLVLSPMERVAQSLQKMVRGTMGGRSKVAQPIVPSAIPKGRGPAGAQYLETFPNAGTLGTTAEDLTWIVAAGALTVVGGQCVVAPTVGDAQAQHDTLTRDQYVQCDYTVVPTAASLFLVGRASGATPMSDEGVYLYIQEDSGNTYVELGNWVPSGLIDSDTIAASPVATWRLELEGTEARAYRNNVLVLSGTCSNVPDGLRAGFELNTSSAIDNFEYGDL